MGGASLVQLLINITVLSSFNILFAVGLALVFGVMKVVNFAHGELYMLGAYAIWVSITYLRSNLPLPFLFLMAIVIGPLLVGGIGIIIERGLFRPLRRNPFAVFMASLGLAYVLQVAVAKAFGIENRTLPTVFPGELNLLGGMILRQRLVVIVFSILMMGCLWYFLMKTRIGRAVRATAQDSTSALLQGISFNMVSALTMGVGAALAAISGLLMGSIISIGPFMGIEVIWKAFIIVVVGGMGSIGGAVLSALLFGVLDSLIIKFGLHQYVTMIDALTMLVVLGFLPQGLLGREV